MAEHLRNLKELQEHKGSLSVLNPKSIDRLRELGNAHDNDKFGRMAIFLEPSSSSYTTRKMHRPESLGEQLLRKMHHPKMALLSSILLNLSNFWKIFPSLSLQDSV
jgi:hypothetical protein